MSTGAEAAEAAEAAAAALTRKRKVRGGHRGSAAQTMNAIDTLLAKEEPLLSTTQTES